MDMIEKHKEALKKPNVYYHWFLNAYHKNDVKELIIFCEGDVDLSYYGELLDHRYPQKRVLKCSAECKNNVLKIWKLIDWKIYDSNRVLFFVDRDFSYWAEEPQFYDSNVYITDGYSFENDAVNEHMFVKCLDDLYGFANCTRAERKRLVELYRNLWKSFIQGSYELMAYAFWHYKTTGKHKSGEIKMSKCLSFGEKSIWRNVIGDECSAKFYETKLGIDSVDSVEIEEIIRRFKAEEDRYSVRGKWCLDFMLMLLEHVMDNAREYVPSLYDGCKKEPKRIINLSERGAMSVLGPKIIPPESLVRFLSENIGEGCYE